jgi:hypothetical protein
LELTFPTELVGGTLLWQMGQAHDVVYNFDQANVSQRRGRVILSLWGTREVVEEAEAFFRKHGVGVTVLKSVPHEGKIPARPRKEFGSPEAPRVQRKIWITWQLEHYRRPIIWEMAHHYDVSFDLRQSSTGETVGIMAMMLEGPESQVDKAIAFIRATGAEVEPIEKSIVEG